MELTSPPPYYSFGPAKSSRSLSVSAAALFRRSSAFVFPTSTRPKTPNFKHSLKPTKTLAPALSTSTPDTVTTPCPPKNKKVLVPIGFGTEEIEAVILVDVLRRAGAEVILASVEQHLKVEASGGTILVADTSICSCSDEVFDLIALPGGMPGAARLRDSELLQKITKKQAEEKRLYSAICAAPAITLLPWGLIRRKRTTCHPAFVDKLPTFWAVKSDIQVSGELTTSRGPGTALRFAISLVDQLFGESVAKGIGDLLLVSAADDIPKKEEFNEVQWSLDHTPNVLIPIANGSEEIEVVTVVDILRRAKANVMIASIEKSLQILASQGTKIVADKLLPAAAETIYDLIILPGGYAGAKRLHKSKVLKGLLKEQVTGGRMVGAMCSSTEILRKQGLMKDKKAAAHNLVMSKIHDAVDGAQVVIDGRLITSKGLGTSIFFGLAIVDKLFGHARARSVAEGLVFEYPRS